MAKRDNIPAFYTVRGDYEASLKRFVDAANLLATALDAYLTISGDGHDLPPEAAKRLLREQLAAFNNARFGGGP